MYEVCYSSGTYLLGPALLGEVVQLVVAQAAEHAERQGTGEAVDLRLDAGEGRLGVSVPLVGPVDHVP